MNKILLIACFLIHSISHAQYSAFGRILANGGSVRGYCITTDPSGNVIISGSTSNTKDAIPGVDEYLISPVEDDTGILLKYSATGEFIWGFGIGGDDTGAQWADDIITDDDGNIYVAGFFVGSCDFDPSANTSILYGGNTDGYIAKYSSDGELIWVREVSSSGADRCHSIAMNSQGDLLISGFLSPGTYIGDVSYTLDPAADGGYVFSMDADGNVNWVSVFQAVTNCNALRISTDANDNIYGIGIFGGSFDLDPGPELYSLQSVGVDDAFYYKLNSNGDFLWGGRLGSVEEDWGYHVAANDIGDVFLAGHTSADFTFGPGDGSQEDSFTIVGNSDAFCVKLNTDGQLQWLHQLGTPEGNARSISVDTDSNGEPLFTGWFRTGLSLDQQAELFLTAPNTTSELFLVKFDTGGELQYAGMIAGEEVQEGRGIFIDDNDEIYLTGISGGMVDLDPGIGEIADSLNGVLFVHLIPEGSTLVNKEPQKENTFPNPLRAESQVKIPFDGHLAVFDSQGKLVKSLPMMRKGEIIAMNLAPGMYYVELSNDSTQIVQKIIVLHD